jgi:hypothetical protein
MIQRAAAAADRAVADPHVVEIGIDLEAHAAAVAGALIGLLHWCLGKKIVAPCTISRREPTVEGRRRVDTGASNDHDFVEVATFWLRGGRRFIRCDDQLDQSRQPRS